MPKATVTRIGEKFELKTLPPTEEEDGGYVVLKRMSYGEKLTRQQMATKQTGKIGGKRVTELDIDLLSRKVAEYEYANCIVEHNLQDDDGNNLNFRDPKSLDMLDPRVGDEINKYIAELNNFEDDEEDQKGN